MPAKNQAGTQQVIPVSLNLTAGVLKRSPAAPVAADANQAVLVLDAAWLTDPTAFINWGIEYSRDGVNWQHFMSGSRPGGPSPLDGGGTTTDIDIEVPLVGVRGAQIRGFIGYVLGDTHLPASATATGTLTLS